MNASKRLLAILAAVLLAALGIATAVASPARAATPCTTSSPTGGCGPYTDPSVFRTANAADLVVQNDFSSIPQTLTVPSASTDWTVNADTSGQQDQTSVKSYPATQVTYTNTSGKPEPSSTFGSTLTSDFTNVIPSGSGQDFEYAVDDWLADPSQPSWTNDMEVMIWTYTNGQVPYGSDSGQVYTDASGTQWEVWVASGGSTVGPDSTVSFVRKVNASSGSLDRMGFYNYLQQHGMLNATYGIDQLNYGLEICSTGGAAKTYGVSGYDIVVNGTGGGGGTGGTAPQDTTNAATNVTSSGATLNGSVNPEGADTSYRFDYGTSTSYGSSTTAGDAGAGTSSVSESASLSGLAASTTYHYRIEATNASGTTYGADRQFTTAAAGGGGGSTVAFDNSAGAKNAGPSSLSWTQIVGSGSNRALLVDFTVGSNNDAGCSPHVTDNGVTMTEITAVHDNNQRAGALVVYGLVNPPSGTNTIAASVKNCTQAPSALTGGSESFTGVSQSAPFGTHVINAGAGATSSVSITAASSSDLEGEFTADGDYIVSANSPVTGKFIENENVNSGAGNTGGGCRSATGGSDAASWTMAASDWWGSAAVDISHA